MICPNCGTQNASGEKICMGCKEPLPEVVDEITAKNDKAMETDVKKKKTKGERVKNKKLLKIFLGILFVAIVVAAIIIIIQVKTRNLSEDDPIIRLETTVNSYSTELGEYLDHILPEKLAGYGDIVLAQISGAEVKNELVEKLESQLDTLYNSYKDLCGDDLKIDFNVLYKEKVHEEQLQEIEHFYATAYSEYIQKEPKSLNQLTEDIKNKYGIKEKNAAKAADALTQAESFCKTMQITEGYDCVVRVSFSGRKNSYDALMDVYVIRVGGSWSLDVKSTYDKLLENPLYNN